MDSKSAVCMANDVKYNNHTRHITRRVHFLKNGKNCKMHKIDWCERGLKLEDIATKTVGENDLNHRMKYITVILDNWDRTHVQYMWHNTG